MTGKKLILSLLLVVLVTLAVIFFTFDLVVYVYPSEMGDFSSRYSHPGFLNWGYLLVSHSDDSVSFLERIKKPTVYIYAPYSLLEDGSRNSSYTLLHYGEKDSLPLSDAGMVATILSLFSSERMALCYEESDRDGESLFTLLNGKYPLLETVTYPERVSVVNVESLRAVADGFYGVVYLDPLSSSELYRTSSSLVIMTESDAIAAVSLESVISLHYDWNAIIKSVLSGDGVTPYCTFSVLHQ